MKFCRYLIFLLLLPLFANSQAGEWTWMKGDSVPNSHGNYGTEGIPSLSNEPCARYACGYWTDTSGNFWVYGGNYAPADLWKFDPTTTEWTLMNGDSTAVFTANVAAAKGVYSSANSPGIIGYGCFTWVTPDNHLWLFGGDIFTNPGNFWQFNPAINQWAWMGNFGYLPNYGNEGMGDSANMPGTRNEGNSAWTDSLGNLWLFGGYNGDIDYADMWQYNVATGIWTWMSGSNVAEDFGVYGLQGTPSVDNYPAARNTNLFWKDNAGNFWLCGGYDIGYGLWYEDIWKFNPQTLEWTWTDGPWSPGYSNPVQPLGTVCETGDSSIEGSRYENRAMWKICDDMIINYGGLNNAYSKSQWNDLWAYYPSQMAWEKIADGLDTMGHYGTQGIAAPLNCPPARVGSVPFKDKNNNLWLFGGGNFEKLQDSDIIYYFNDLWKYVLDTSCLGSSFCRTTCAISPPNITATDDTICSSDSAQICAPNNFSNYNWNPAAGGATGNCIEATGAGDYYVTITDNNGCTAESNHIGIAVLQSPPISISGSGDTLRVYNATNIQWYLNNNPINGATQNIYIADTFGSYTVSVTDTDGCTSYSSPIDYTGIFDISGDDNVSIYPNPLSVGKWQMAVGNNLIGEQLEILDDNGRIVYKSEIKNTHSEIAAPLACGVYLLRITYGAGIVARKLVKL